VTVGRTPWSADGPLAGLLIVCSDHDTANEDPLPLQSNKTTNKKPRKVNSVRLNSHLYSHIIPAIIPKNSPISPRYISPENPVTARISMKTIIKPRMPFFPSCILVLGVLFSPERAACGDTPTGSLILLRRTLAPAARSVLPFAAPRIFSKKLFSNKLFDNCINRHQPARQASSRRPSGSHSEQLLVPPATLFIIC
jgi:hypothetical protein